MSFGLSALLQATAPPGRRGRTIRPLRGHARLAIRRKRPLLYGGDMSRPGYCRPGTNRPRPTGGSSPTGAACHDVGVGCLVPLGIKSVSVSGGAGPKVQRSNRFRSHSPAIRCAAAVPSQARLSAAKPAFMQPAKVTQRSLRPVYTPSIWNAISGFTWGICLQRRPRPSRG